MVQIPPVPQSQGGPEGRSGEGAPRGQEGLPGGVALRQRGRGMQGRMRSGMVGRGELHRIGS